MGKSMVKDMQRYAGKSGKSMTKGLMMCSRMGGKPMTTAAGKSGVKVGDKVMSKAGAKLASMGTKLMTKLSMEPLGIALMVFDIICRWYGICGTLLGTTMLRRRVWFGQSETPPKRTTPRYWTTKNSTTRCWPIPCTTSPAQQEAVSSFAVVEGFQDSPAKFMSENEVAFVAMADGEVVGGSDRVREVRLHG